MSFYGCDICMARAERFVEGESTEGGAAAAAGRGGGARGGRNRAKVDKRMKTKGATMVYPAGTRGELRTHERHLEIASRTGPMDDELNDFYGIHEGVPFLTDVVPHLDIIRDIPIDWRARFTLGFFELMSLRLAPTSFHFRMEAG